MLKCLDIHKGLLVVMLIFLGIQIIFSVIMPIFYRLSKRDKKSGIEVSDYLYFKSIFAKFNNSDNDCREIRTQKIDFLKTVFSENLSHARHIEMERMTFNSIYTVLIAGIFAFVNSNVKSCVKDCTCSNQLCTNCIANELILFFGFFTGFILFCVSIRWKDVYNRHLLYAKVSYIYLNDMLFPDLFPDEKTVEIEGCSKYLNEEFELFDNKRIFSLYCFKPAHITGVIPEFKHKIHLKTYQYFLILDIFIEVLILIAFMHITGILNI